MLTPKQQRFVDEYLVDSNGTRAAIRAGYSPRTANEQASQLLAKLSVASAVRQQQQALADRNELTQDWVIQRIVENVERAMQIQAVRDEAGNVVEYTYQGSVANKALEMLGRFLGLNGFASVVNNDNRTLNLNGLNVDELKALAAYVRSE